MKNYGENLKDHRLARGLTLKDIENKIGINNGNLSRWERGEVLPNIEFCIKLANFYGISIEELLGLDDFGSPTAAPIIGALSYSSEERELVEKYRNLPDKLKELVRSQIDIYSSPNELIFKSDKKV